MQRCQGENVLLAAPFKFGVLWALFFVSFFFLDGTSQDGTYSPFITWAAVYLLLSSGTLLAVLWFHKFFHRHDPKNYTETTAWFFLAGACVALGVFTWLWPVWFPIAAGAFLCGVRSVGHHA